MNQIQKSQLKSLLSTLRRVPVCDALSTAVRQGSPNQTTPSEIIPVDVSGNVNPAAVAALAALISAVDAIQVGE